MHTSLGPGAQMLFRQKWRKLATASLLFHCILMNIVASVVGMGFLIWVSGFRLKFSGIALLRKRWQLDSKTDLITNGLILGYFVGIWLFCWPHISMDWHLEKVLKCSFLTVSNLFDSQFEGYSGLFINCACVFQANDFVISIDRL